MIIRDLCLLDDCWKTDTIKIRMYTLKTGRITVLEETPLIDVHEAWWKFEVIGFDIIPYRDASRVCIVANIRYKEDSDD